MNGGECENKKHSSRLRFSHFIPWENESLLPPHRFLHLKSHHTFESEEFFHCECVTKGNEYTFEVDHAEETLFSEAPILPRFAFDEEQICTAIWGIIMCTRVCCCHRFSLSNNSTSQSRRFISSSIHSTRRRRTKRRERVESSIIRIEAEVPSLGKYSKTVGSIFRRSRQGVI